MDLRDLKQKVKIPTRVFDMTLGAPVEQGAMQLLKKSDSVIVHRNAPAPAHFRFAVTSSTPANSAGWV